ncbi:MAG: NUDIX domain-containing protein [Pseudomonadota bacterium]
MTPLFLFGTLRHLPLLETVIGPTDHLGVTPANAPGFAVDAVADGPFPSIRTASQHAAPGLLLSGLTEGDRARLDYYEGTFDYRLAPLTLEDGSKAEAYFPQGQDLTVIGPWLLEDWEADWAELSVLSAKEVMSYYGTRAPEEIASIFARIRARAWSALNAKASRHGAGTFEGAIVVENRERAYSNFFGLDEFKIRHDRFDGSETKTLDRAVFVVGDATLVLPYDPLRDRVLLVEQMRLGPLARGDKTCWQFEPVAGLVDAGETPEAGARREALEEAGIHIDAIFPVAETYSAPGNSSEFHFLYVGLADLPDGINGVGGLEAEDEDIRSHLFSFDRLMELCDAQEVANGPLALAAYWLDRHRDRLRRQVATQV